MCIIAYRSTRVNCFPRFTRFYFIKIRAHTYAKALEKQKERKTHVLRSLSYFAVRSVLIQNVDLHGTHSRKRIFVRRRRHARRAGGIHRDVGLGKGSLQQHGVGNDADIGAKTAQLDVFYLAVRLQAL